ncbi:Hypothetical protein, putative [Bodo saltans]|uniref:Uncharacterized protein n=1 Tax=Bodo saltans TaxID=75058 RepID=A0A0S4INT1_BODSA|nr:Hypothetical protein, putative [Bodo saltans]|eukprot:CUE63111.1 Hypothetical protein, putative [Bodo saltans]
MEIKIAVVGDEKCGKTLLCHRFQRGPEWPTTSDALALVASPPRKEFFFASYADSIARTRDAAPDESDWYDISQLNSTALKLIEPCGANRSSLQQIIFRNVCGLVVVIDVLNLWEEFIATDAPAPETGRSSSTQLRSWQLFLNQTVMYWVRMASFGTNFSDLYDARFPVSVVFSKTDLLTKAFRSSKQGKERRYTADDGTVVPLTLDFFFNTVSQFCCQDKHKRKGAINRKKNSKDTAQHTSSNQSWKIDYDIQDEGVVLVCEGCYFVSSVDQSQCPNRTHDAVNDMIETFVSSIHPFRKGAEQKEQMPEKKGKKGSCCS